MAIQTVNLSKVEKQLADLLAIFEVSSDRGLVVFRRGVHVRDASPRLGDAKYSGGAA